MSLYQPSPRRRAFDALYQTLVVIPVACFVGALATDIVYWRAAEMMWTNFSAWLISAGVIIGYLVAIVGLIALLTDRDRRGETMAWLHAVGAIIALLLATANMFVHTRDAWTSVVPTGLSLSAATVFAIAFSAVMGWSMRSRTAFVGARA